MIQGYMHFTKVSRAGSSGKGGGCDGRPRVALPLPSELLVTVLTPIIVRGLESVFIAHNPLGPGSSLHLLKYWVSPVCFTFLMGCCRVIQVTGFLHHQLWPVQSDRKTFDWRVVRAAFGPNPLLYWFSYWCETWLPWSYSEVAAVELKVESGIRVSFISLAEENWVISVKIWMWMKPEKWNSVAKGFSEMPSPVFNTGWWWSFIHKFNTKEEYTLSLSV